MQNRVKFENVNEIFKLLHKSANVLSSPSFDHVPVLIVSTCEKPNVSNISNVSQTHAGAFSLQKFGSLIRGHWSIENQLHWVLNATFHEDSSLIRKDHSPQNLSTLRKIAMALLKKDSTRKASLRRKQNFAAWDNDFFASLFALE